MNKFAVMITAYPVPITLEADPEALGVLLGLCPQEEGVCGKLQWLGGGRMILSTRTREQIEKMMSCSAADYEKGAKP